MRQRVRDWLRWAATPAFFAVVATGLLSPLASDVLIPYTTDLVPHVTASWQARLAVDEGQLPLRVAPLERAGRRYALFQFYGQLPYTAAGALQRWLLPDTLPAPYVALKRVLWLTLVLGGLYLFRLARYLGAPAWAALVGGVAYMAAPYLLVNIHARGAIVEAMAQGLLPLSLYHLLRFVAGGRRGHFVMATLAVTAILLTHLITFAYSLVAAGGMVLLLARRRRALRLARAAAVAAGTLLLSLYFVAPIFVVRGYLPITGGLRAPMGGYRWLTHLSSLLSPASVPPVPAGSPDLPPFIHPAVGLASLTGAVLAVALLLGLGGQAPRPLRRFGPALLSVFGLGLLLAWSPVNVWAVLPDVLSLAQFTYRLLTLTMWTGALLLALALAALASRTQRTAAAAAGCVLVLLASGSYLTSAPPWRVGAQGWHEVRRMPISTATQQPYSTQLNQALLARPDTLVELTPPGSGASVLPVALGRRLAARPARLFVTGTLPAARAAQGVSLALHAAGQELARVRVAGETVAQSVALSPLREVPDRLTIEFQWTADAPAAELAGLRAIVSGDEPTFARVLAGPGVDDAYARAVGESRGDAFVARTSAEEEALLVLPVLFYPRLLDVRVGRDAAPSAAFVTRSGEVLAAVRLPPGRHRVRARFGGLPAANVISAGTLLALLVLGASTRWRRR